MIRLQSDTIHYLTEEVVNAFSNVSIISKSQLKSLDKLAIISRLSTSPLIKGSDMISFRENSRQILSDRRIVAGTPEEPPGLN